MHAKSTQHGPTTLTPRVTLVRVDAAIAFYARAFGAVETRRVTLPSGHIPFAEIRIGTSALMLREALHEPVQTMHAIVRTEDCDAFVARAKSAGAQVLAPPTDTLWGERTAHLRDPFGNEWWIVTRTDDPSDAELERRLSQAAQQQQQ